MKFPTNLSGGLLLALTITVPSVFMSTSAQAQVSQTPANGAITRQGVVRFSPNLVNKVDVLRPGGLAGKDGFRDRFKDSFKEKGKINPAEVITQPAIRNSAVDTFRSLNVPR